MDPSYVVTALAVVLLVAFGEETAFRGVLLKALLPRGVWPAVLASSALFGLMHLVNLALGAPWQAVMLQMLFAAMGGVGLPPSPSAPAPSGPPSPFMPSTISPSALATSRRSAGTPTRTSCSTASAGSSSPSSSCALPRGRRRPSPLRHSRDFLAAPWDPFIPMSLCDFESPVSRSFFRSARPTRAAP